MAKDKEIDKVLNLLPRHAKYYFTKAQIPRALSEQDLQQLAAAKQLQGLCFTNVNVALASATANATEKDLIIVCGSVFVVGEVER
jgi:dihydrofolate synthase/folylpolyglutamate synthase